MKGSTAGGERPIDPHYNDSAPPENRVHATATEQSSLANLPLLASAPGGKDWLGD